jgi:hypothetical protein
VTWYARWMERLGLTTRPRLRKTIIAVIGTTVILFGLALIVLPGPAVVVAPLGLAILATEFAWARRLVKRGGDIWARWRGGKTNPSRNSLGDDAI